MHQAFQPRRRATSVMVPQALLTLVLIALVGTACRPAGPPGGGPAPGTPSPQGTRPVQRVQVIAKEWAFDPSPLVATAGPIMFAIKNTGSVEHNFLVEDQPGAQVEAIPPGESKTLMTQLAAGRYVVFCNLPGHREAGMHGVLDVR